VSSYTITITPDDTTNASATLRVNLGLRGPRITELTVRAGDGDGFAPEDLPGFELSRLIGAIAPGRAASAAALAAPTVDVVHAPAGPEPRRGRRGAKAATKATAKKTAAKKVTAKKATKKTGEREARAYRRMPDDVVAVFREAGGATALARHYEVPRHTAQGWLRRLRQQGDI
jgi:hypothetical protein